MLRRQKKVYEKKTRNWILSLSDTGVIVRWAWIFKKKTILNIFFYILFAENIQQNKEDRQV